LIQTEIRIRSNYFIR